MKPVEWKTYRTRFLVKAKQLSSTLSFTDPLGRQHCGRKGDYLVESSDGVISIAPRKIFEDIYVALTNTAERENHEAKIGELMIAEARISEAKLREATTGETKTSAARINESQLNRLPMEALAIEEVKLSAPIRRQRIAEARPIQNEVLRHEIVRHDDDARVRRKLPQPCRDRRSSSQPSRLGLM